MLGPAVVGGLVRKVPHVLGVCGTVSKHLDGLGLGTTLGNASARGNIVSAANQDFLSGQRVEHFMTVAIKGKVVA